MARVTVEDCVDKVPNRFDLVMLAAQRARNITAGAPLTVERDNDKNPVVSLRELAEETIVHEDLEAALVRGLQKYVENDEPEIDDLDILEAMQDEANGVVDAEAPDEEMLNIIDTTAAADAGGAVVPQFEDAVEAVNEATVEPAVEAVVEPAVEAVVEPAVEAVVEPAVEAVVEPTVEAAVEPTVEAVVEPTEGDEKV